MGPFDVERQFARIANCDRILEQPNLAPQARRLWTEIRNNIALDEETYNARVYWAYRHHTQEIVEWNP